MGADSNSIGCQSRIIRLFIVIIYCDLFMVIPIFVI